MTDFQRLVKNKWKFKAFLIMKLPLAWLAGVRVNMLTDKMAEVSVPYKWLSTNPFKSTYFAALSMAAEMSTGLLVLNCTENNAVKVSTLVRLLEAEFVKKATGTTLFRCEDGEKIKRAVQLAIDTGEAQEIEATTVGYSLTNEEIARFKLTWGIKRKSKQ